MDRIIGEYTQDLPGPLFICIGGMHGNERAGIRAIDLVLRMLKTEILSNPDFNFRGTFIGLIGHVAASLKGVRFIEKDLNRMWTSENIKAIIGQEFSSLGAEEQELLKLENTIRKEITRTGTDQVVILDLHTTSADGGIYTIVPSDHKSIRIARQLIAPVVLGMLEKLKGTTLHYFNSDNFPVETISLCFEAGQHQDPMSVNRAVAVMVKCMRHIGCIKGKDVENRHLKILREYANKLPNITRLAYRHAINSTDHFEMLPGFKNFDRIHAGQLLATDKSGNIAALCDGYILMPLYQVQGEDGFFVVNDVDDTIFHSS